MRLEFGSQNLEDTMEALVAARNIDFASSKKQSTRLSYDGGACPENGVYPQVHLSNNVYNSISDSDLSKGGKAAVS